MSAFSRKTYDTDVITLRRIFANDPVTNNYVSAGLILVSGEYGSASFQDILTISSINQISTMANTGAVSGICSLSTVVTVGLSTLSTLFGSNGTFFYSTTNYFYETISTVYADGTNIFYDVQNVFLNLPYLSSYSLSTGNVTTSTISFKDTTTNATQLLAVSSGILTLNGQAITGGGTGDVTKADLVSTVAGLGTTGYLSTVNLTDLVSTANLIGLVSTANLSGLVSTVNLQNLISTPNLLNLVSTTYLQSQIVSTVEGLGTAGYISSLSTINLSTQNLTTSTITFKDINTGSNQILAVSSGTLILNGQGITGGGGGVGDVTSNNLVSTVIGLGTAGYVSTLSNWSQFQAISQVTLYDQNPRIVNNGTLTGTTVLQTESVTIEDANNAPGFLILNSVSFRTSTSAATYTFANDEIISGSVSSLSLLYSAGLNGGTGSLYLSSIYLGSLGGTVYGQLTTNGTATDLFWNGSTLVGGGGGEVTTSQLVSTVIGFQTDFNTQKISTGFVQLSSLNMLDSYTNTLNYLTVSSGSLLLNDGFITGSGGGAVTKILAGSNISISPPEGTGAVTVNNTIDPTGLVSTANLSGLVSTQNLIGLVSTANLSGLISTQNLIGLVSTQNLIGLVSTGNLSGLVSTQNLIGLVSTGNLSGLVSTGNLSGLVSTANLSGLVSTGNLRGLVSTANLVGLVSTPNLSGILSTGSILGLVSTANLSNLVSTPNLLNLVSTSYFDSQLVSTVEGLGQVYLSSLPPYLSAISISTGSLNVSSILFFDETNPTANLGVITNTVFGMAYRGSAHTFVNNEGNTTTTAIAKSFDLVSANPDVYVYSIAAGSDYTSTISAPTIVNTVVASTASLYISSLFLGNLGATSYGELGTNQTGTDLYWNGVSILGGGGVTTGELVSTTSGLQTNFIGQQATLSSLYVNLNPDSAPPWNSNFPAAGFDPDPSPLAVDIYGSLRILKNIYIGSTTTLIGTGGIQTALFYGSTITAQSLVSAANLLASTVTLMDIRTLQPQILAVSSGILTLNGLGITGGGGGALSQIIAGSNINISPAEGIGVVTVNNTINPTGLVSTANLSGLISTPNMSGLLSTGSILGFVSTANLSRLVSTQNLVGLVSTANLINIVSTSYLTTQLTSSIIGLGSAGYVSTSQLVSTTAGLQSYISTFIDPVELASTVTNLISATFFTNSLASTVAGLATAGYISTPQLVSTVRGLGNAGYLSSYISSFLTLSTGSLGASSINVITANVSTVATISSLIVNSLQFGDGTGWVNIGPIQAVALSTLQLNTNALYANSNFFGTISSQTALQFYGLQGNYNNTVVAEQSTGRGTQELLLFKGSSAADQVRIQTTGSIVFEPGVTSRLWPFNAQLSTPTMILNNSQYVGIWVSSPQVQLDVGGTGRFITLSTLALNVSSIAGISLVQTSNLTSTVAGLGTAGYVSTASLIGIVSTPNLQNLVSTANLIGLVSTQNLINHVSTANLIGLVSTPNLQNLVSTGNLSGLVSTPNLLNLVSTSFLNTSLVSTTVGLQTYISSFIDPVELASTVANLISTTAFQNGLASTVTGLGTAGYVSTASLLRLVSTPNLVNLISTANLIGLVSTPNLQNLVSTANLSGLVSTPNLLNLVSTPYLASQLTSTVIGLGSAGYVSSASLIGLVSTPNLLNLVSTPNLLNHVSTANLLGLVSTPNLLNLVSTANLSGLVSTPNLLNLVSTSFLNTSLVSTTVGLQTYISSFIDPVELASTVANLISTTAFQNALASTVTGLGTAGYVSTANLIGLVSTPNLIRLVSTPNLLNLVSTQNLIGLVSTPNLLNLVSTQNLIGLVSTPNLINLVSTANLIGLVSTPNLLNLISTMNLADLVSSPNLLNLVSTSYLTSVVNGLGSLGYVSTSYFVSYLSNAIQFLTIPYLTYNPTVDNIFQLKAETDELNFGTLGEKAQIYIADVQAAALTFNTTDPVVVIDQKGFLYTNTTQFTIPATDYYTVPPGVTEVDVILTGAGGGDNISASFTGGTGGYVSGKLAVTPGEILTIIVGEQGAQTGSNTIGGGGAGVAGLTGDGGGRSAIRRLLLDVVTAGGGGGAGIAGNGGNGGGSTGQTGSGKAPGEGGTQSAGGASGGGNATSGNKNLGGNGDTGSGQEGGGGGSGNFGGGGGTGESGGGGGSSLVTNLYGTVVDTQGGGGTPHQDGSVTISYSIQLKREADILQIRNYISSYIKVDPYLRVGINVSSIASSFQLDVNGAARMSTLTLGSLPSTGILTTDGTRNLFWNGAPLTNQSSNWSLYPAISSINMTGINPTIINGKDELGAPLKLQTKFLLVEDSNYAPATIYHGTSVFATSTNASQYIIKNDALITGNVSSLGLAYTDGASNNATGSLYLSSIYLGELGGSIYGQLTTNGTATDLFWNGSTLVGGGTGGGITTDQLVSTIISLQTDFATEKISTGFVELSTLNLLDTYTNATNYLTVSTGTLLLNGGFITGSGGSAVSQILAGTNISVSPAGGTGIVTINNSIDPTGLVSTANLTGLVSTANLSGLLSTGSILGLVSTANLSGLVSTQNLTGLISTANLSGLISTQNLTGLISTANLSGLVSTQNLRGLVSTANLSGLLSTGSILGFVSTANLIGVVSTPNLLNLVSTTYLATQLTSTVVGLGTAGYVSTASLTSTLTAVGIYLSTMSSSYASYFFTNLALISSLTVSSLTFGTGDGYLAMPDIRPTAVSTLVTQTSSLTAFNLLIGATSSLTAIQYFGLLGNFNNTAVAERSISTGAQEFLVFKGSSTADQIRFQTTGIFEIETGVSSRLWPNVPQISVPAFLIDINSNVGIQTSSPGATLDVAGSIRSRTISTQQIRFSTLFGGFSQTGIESSVQITASSIYATLAGPTTFVLLEA
jgi:hypothetical protein